MPRNKAAKGEPWTFLEIAAAHKGPECLTWPFGREANGRYGAVHDPTTGRQVRAHRVVCERVNGPALTPLHQAAHSCGKGHEACVSGAHLSWKTAAGNSADAKAHGTWAHGEKCRRKLTRPEAAAILVAEGSHAEIAARFGVCRSNVSQIKRKEIWK